MARSARFTESCRPRRKEEGRVPRRKPALLGKARCPEPDARSPKPACARQILRAPIPPARSRGSRALPRAPRSTPSRDRTPCRRRSAAPAAAAAARRPGSTRGGVLEAGAGRDEPAHRDVLLQAPQVIDLAGDGRLGEHARRLLERRGRDERVGRERRLRDPEQQRPAGTFATVSIRATHVPTPIDDAVSMTHRYIVTCESAGIRMVTVTATSSAFGDSITTGLDSTTAPMNVVTTESIVAADVDVPVGAAGGAAAGREDSADTGEEHHESRAHDASSTATFAHRRSEPTWVTHAGNAATND